MAEASILYEGYSLEGVLETARDYRTSEFMVIPSSLTQSDNKAKKSIVMAAPRSRKSTKPRASRNSRKSELEDQIEERMRASIETRISSFEEKMLVTTAKYGFTEFVGYGYFLFTIGTVQHFGCMPTNRFQTRFCKEAEEGIISGNFPQ